ncbi:MAG: hypothetical protein P8M80_09905 [Pirellulaceae bacterium]|nr:hypothetical protein [Pirellulaceae bacterium]
MATVLGSLNAPEDHPSPEEWPSEEDIAKATKSVTVEISDAFQRSSSYQVKLSAESVSDFRAIKMVRRLTLKLQNHLNRYLSQSKQNIISQLAAKLDVAHKNLQQSKTQLDTIIRNQGPLFEELQSKHPDGIRDGLQQGFQLAGVISDIQSTQRDQQSLIKLGGLLSTAEADPEQLLLLSNQQLIDQPILQQLHNQFIEEKAMSCVGLDLFSPDDPEYKLGMQSDQTTPHQIVQKIASLALTVTTKISANRDRLDGLEEQKKELVFRIEKIFGSQNGLLELTRQWEQHQADYEQARLIFSESSHIFPSDQAGTPVTIQGDPVVHRLTNRPYSIRLVMIAAGLAGLTSGLGLIFFASSPGGSPSQRPVLSNSPSQSQRDPAWRREIFESQQAARKTHSAKPNEALPQPKHNSGTPTNANPPSQPAPTSQQKKSNSKIPTVTEDQPLIFEEIPSTGEVEQSNLHPPTADKPFSKLAKPHSDKDRSGGEKPYSPTQSNVPLTAKQSESLPAKRSKVQASKTSDPNSIAAPIRAEVAVEVTKPIGKIDDRLQKEHRRRIAALFDSQDRPLNTPY